MSVEREVDRTVIDGLERILRPLAKLHRFRLEGAEHVPRTGACLLVVHHSFATYDGFLLGGAIYEATGRIPRGLGDDAIFHVPGLERLAWNIGLVPASPEAGERLLREGHLLGVAPGGMWEALRPKAERRQSRWGSRRGFVRLALRTGAPILCGAVPRADELYTVYPSRVTDRVYQRHHLPLPLLRGLGPTLLPRPIALTGYLAPPIQPPPWEPEREAEQVEALYEAARAAMGALLAR